MSVSTSVVRDTIVGRMAELAREAAGDGSAAARGYELRRVERRLFEPARAPMPGLAERLRARIEEEGREAAAIDSLSRELADAEPLDRPDPGDERAATWKVPGPGGHVRHYVVIELAGSQDPEARREVLFGFFRRCCEEALEAAAG